jgi:hypothetical protein
MDYHTICDKVDCKYYQGNVRQEDRCRLNCIHNISFCKDYYTPKGNETKKGEILNADKSENVDSINLDR